MRRLKNRWNSLSRPVKVLLMLLLLFFAALITYLFIDSPPLSPRMNFRRIEKASLLGPSEILGELTLQDPYYDREDTYIIAQTQNTDILYSHSRYSMYDPGSYIYDSGIFQTYAKTELPALYVIRASSYYRYIPERTRPMSLILFDRNPQAVRGEIEFSVTEYEDGQPYTFRFSESALREYDQFFHFTITPEETLEEMALLSFAQDCREYDPDHKPTVTVRLYGQDGVLITETEILPGPSVP